MHLVGSGPGIDFHDAWRELGVLEGRRFDHIHSFGRYVGTDGRALDLYTDPGRLEEHLLALTPIGIARFLRSLPALPLLSRWSGVSAREWSAGLKSPFLREAIPAILGMVDFPLAGPITVFAMMWRGSTGYPLGGSRPLAEAVERRAHELGAEFEYGTSVRRVLVEDDTAVDVELEGRVRDPAYEAMFRDQAIHPSLIQVSLGARIDPEWRLESLPQKLYLPLSRPIVIDGSEQRRVAIHQYARDPNMAPPGGTVMLVRFAGSHERWTELARDRSAYTAEKERVLQATVSALEEHFPGIAARLEASDVATPPTCVRYTGNWRGSMQGWVLTPELMKGLLAGRRLPRTFDAVKRFYLIGQWTELGSGLPPAARSGRDVVRLMCMLRAPRPRPEDRGSRSRVPVRPSIR